MTTFPILTTTLLAPVFAALIIVFINKENAKLIKSVAAVGTGISLALSLYVYFGYDQLVGGLQWVDFGKPVPWVHRGRLIHRGGGFRRRPGARRGS